MHGEIIEPNYEGFRKKYLQKHREECVWSIFLTLLLFLGLLATILLLPDDIPLVLDYILCGGGIFCLFAIAMQFASSLDENGLVATKTEISAMTGAIDRLPMNGFYYKGEVEKERIKTKGVLYSYQAKAIMVAAGQLAEDMLLQEKRDALGAKNQRSVLMD